MLHLCLSMSKQLRQLQELFGRPGLESQNLHQQTLMSMVIHYRLCNHWTL